MCEAIPRAGLSLRRRELGVRLSFGELTSGF
jgi:hypothetical protein